MNSFDRIIAGFVAAPEGLRELLGDWDEMDAEEREHHADDTLWLLRAVRSQLNAVDQRFYTTELASVAQRVARVNVQLLAMSTEIERKMGIRVGRYLVPGLTAGVASTSRPSKMPVDVEAA